MHISDRDAYKHRAQTKHHHGKRIVMVDRLFHDDHIAAGYQEQEWGPHARPESPLLGEYEGAVVRYLEDGPTGPEFEIEFPGGQKVTVLDEDVVRQYLAAAGISL